MTEVVLRSASSQRVLLSPVKTSPKGTEIKIFSSPSQVPSSLLNSWKSSPLLALDFETNGTDISLPSFKAVGVGVSDGKLSVYVNLLTCSPEEKKTFLLTLARLPLVGHNVYFDGGVFYREIGYHANWKFCTYGLTKQLSSEDQTKKAGLKTLQTELLGWEDSNEKELDQWLVDFGYHKENHFLSPREGVYLKTGEKFYYRPDKSQMWQAPQRILGHYCCLDAYSTYLLFQRVLSPAMDQVDRLSLEEYHKKDFLTEVEILIENWLQGITIDKERLHEHQKILKRQIDEAKNSFLSNEVISPLLQAFNTDILDDLERSKPPKYRKPPKLGQEPARLTKSGDPSRNWEKWNLRREELERWSQDPANISKSFLNWEERKLALEKELEETGGFNLNSAHHLKWLVYDKLGFKPLVFTKSGQPGVGEDALTPLSPLFEDLVTYKTLTKELGYVDACLENLRQGKDGLWRIHPQYSVPGTLTGRLAGTGGVNCFHPDTEYLTRDKGWMKVSELKEGMEIWQVDPITKQGSWTIPQVIHQMDYSGNLYCFGGNRGELKVTENHRMAWYGGKNQNFKYLHTTEASIGSSINRPLMLHSSYSEIGKEFPPEEIWKVCLLQADGSLRKNRPEGRFAVGLFKSRKVQKCRELFGKETNFYKYPGTNGQYRWSSLIFKSELLNSDKTLNLKSLSTKQAPILLSALSFWDGYKRKVKGTNIEYSSIVEKNIDEVCAYFCRAGYNVSKRKYKSCFRAYITDNLHSDFKKETHLRLEKYEGKVYCVTVPTGHLLVRSGGRCWVTGNCQQLPKSRGYLSCWKPMEEGKIWVDFDVTALEPVVLTELSRDKGMMSIYGPGVQFQDIYLYFGSSIPGIGKQIIEAGYSPDSPTKEGTSNAKKTCKALRNICKTVVLAKQYGAGARKIHHTLTLNGSSLSLDEVELISQSYNNTFRGVKEFEARLKREWEENKGWYLNGLGLPIALSEDYLKDITNRCLSGNTLVLTKDLGWIKLKNITKKDLVWDGKKWCSHSGLICKGKQPVINFNGVNMTPDHKVLTNNGMKEAQNVDPNSLEKVTLPRFTWKDFWRLSNNFLKQVVKK